MGAAVLGVSGIAANLFQLQSTLGWWRTGIALAILSLAVGAWRFGRELRSSWREMARLKADLDAVRGAQRGGEYLRTPAAVVNAAADMLRDSTSSLDYYGGLNLINAARGNPDGRHEERAALDRWRAELSDRYRDGSFAVSRYIDFIDPSELASLYQSTIQPEVVAGQVEEYVTWIDAQREAMAHGADGNAFYDLRGAPIWQWGLHVLVFDRRHVLLVFASTRRNYRALVLRDSEAAADIHDALAAWHRNLKPRPLSVEQLQTAVAAGRAWLSARTAQPVAAVPARAGQDAPTSTTAPRLVS